MILISRIPKTEKKKTQKNTSKVKDILQSKPKFLIFSTLSMFSELTLKQLTKIIGKSKSTISFHLSDMRNVGIVEISREETKPGKIPTKYFKLAPDYEEKLANVHKKDWKKLDKEMGKDMVFLRQSYTFVQTQIQLLEIYQKYILKLVESIDNGQNESVHDEISDLKNRFNYVPDSAYKLLHQYNAKQNTMVFVNFQHDYQ